MNHGGGGRGLLRVLRMLLRPVVLHLTVLTAVRIAGFMLELSNVVLHGLGYFRHDPKQRSRLVSQVSTGASRRQQEGDHKQSYPGQRGRTFEERGR